MDTEERNRKDEGEDEPSANAGQLRARLALVGHYALLGLAPVLSAVALIFALLAYTGNQSNRTQLNEISARLDGISTSHSESKGETDIFQVSLAREKALLAEERKKQVDKDAKIISSVTQLQNKLKVSPTLEEQMKEAAKASSPRPPASWSSQRSAIAMIDASRLCGSHSPSHSGAPGAALRMCMSALRCDLGISIPERVIAVVSHSTAVRRWPIRRPRSVKTKRSWTEASR